MGDDPYAALRPKSPGPACCCKRGLECDALKKKFAESKDSSGNLLDTSNRGKQPYKVGWIRSKATEEWKAAFAASLQVSKKTLDEIAYYAKADGDIYVNRHHFDPRQIAFCLTKTPWRGQR
jgi:hypothetical protein